MTTRPNPNDNEPVPAGTLQQHGVQKTPSRVGHHGGDPAARGELTPEQVAELVRREREGRS